MRSSAASARSGVRPLSTIRRRMPAAKSSLNGVSTPVSVATMACATASSMAPMTSSSSAAESPIAAAITDGSTSVPLRSKTTQRTGISAPLPRPDRDESAGLVANTISRKRCKAMYARAMRAVPWLLAVALLVALILSLAARGDSSDPVPDLAKDCPRENVHDTQPGKRLKKPITLTPAPGSDQRIINVDADRDPEIVRSVRLQASRPLPKTVEPNQIEIYADPLTRTGDDSLETVSFPEPRFSEPRFINNRRRI